jgi:hypothetical protein
MRPVLVGNLHSEILVLQSAQNWHRQRATDSLDGTRARSSGRTGSASALPVFCWVEFVAARDGRPVPPDLPPALPDNVARLPLKTG